MPSRSKDPPLKVVIFAASPEAQVPLALNHEVREIQRALEGSRFEAVVYMATRVKDLLSGLLSHRPTLVHFCGHTESRRGIQLEDDRYGSESFTERGLAGLLGNFSEHLRCVVLNTCDSSSAAAGIAKKIDYAVGMRSLIADDVSILFATAFYRSLASGETVEGAFEIARQIMAGVSRADGKLPVLKQRKPRGVNRAWPLPDKAEPRQGPEGGRAQAAIGSPRSRGTSTHNSGVMVTGGQADFGPIAIGKDSNVWQFDVAEASLDLAAWERYLTSVRRGLSRDEPA